MTTKQIHDIAVVGAGVFGAWTAYQLRKTGASVILIDQYAPGNSRSSSGGETRIMRLGYGPDEVYIRLAQRSLELWRDLIKQTGQTLFQNTGVLWLAREEDPYSRSTVANFKRANVVFETLTRTELDQRYPQMEFGPITWAILEPESGALMARQSVLAVVQLARSHGVTYVNDTVLAPEGTSDPDSLATIGGSKIRAKKFVFACGPWLPKVFPDLLGQLIHVTRQEVFFFGTPSGDPRFACGAMPIWIDFNDLVYAIPDVDGRGFKLALDAHGPEFDPDKGDRTISSEGLSAARRYLSQRVPALTGAPLLESRVCQYENTWNGDFLIDLHPVFRNVWLVGGGSGHGFKHGPAVGEYVASLICGSGVAEPRFTLGSKRAARERKVF